MRRDGILSWLTGTAAASIALLMIFAAIFHARRFREGRNIATNVRHRPAHGSGDRSRRGIPWGASSRASGSSLSAFAS
jgi:hypothetical protein